MECSLMLTFKNMSFFSVGILVFSTLSILVIFDDTHFFFCKILISKQNVFILIFISYFTLLQSKKKYFHPHGFLLQIWKLVQHNNLKTSAVFLSKDDIMSWSFINIANVFSLQEGKVVGKICLEMPAENV